jgi:hypothetical protein
MAAFLVLILVLAAAAWLTAVVSALSLVGLAPSGSRFATLNDLGRWRFGSIETRIGSAALAPMARYRMAFVVFFLCVLAGMAAGFARISNTAASG